MYSSEHIITSKHYMVLCVCAFCIGILFSVEYRQYCFIAKCAAIGVCAASLTLTAAIIVFKDRPRHIKPLLVPAILAAFAVFGILRCESADNRRTVLADCDDAPVWVYGRVVSVPALSSNKRVCRFELNVRTAEIVGCTAKTNEDIIVSAPAEYAGKLSLNDTVTFWGEIKPVTAGDFASSKSYAKYLKSKNIFFSASAQTLRRSALPPSGFSLSDAIRRIGIVIHLKISAACDAMFSENPNVNALMKGMLVGDKSDFSPELYSSMSNAGISHIAAVSGMHTSILFSVVTYILAFGGMNKKAVLIFSIPAILLFAAASAFTPSVCRSSLMLAVMILSVIAERRYTPINSLFLALGIIVFVSPYAIYSSSLLLSFGASFGILLFGKYISALFYQISRRTAAIKIITDSLTVSMSSFIGTSFFTAIFFNRISLIQFITNLWIIPVVTFTFCAGYLCCILYFLLPVSVMKLLSRAAAGGGELIYMTAKAFGSDRFSIYAPIGSLPYPVWAIYAATVLILYLLLKTAYDNAAEKSLRNRKNAFY